LKDWAASYWVKQGVPAAMINIGIGLYGRSFTLSDPSKYGVGAPVTGPGKAGKFTMEEGFVAYYEVNPSIINKNA
jgi:chitinase